MRLTLGNFRVTAGAIGLSKIPVKLHGYGTHENLALGAHGDGLGRQFHQIVLGIRLQFLQFVGKRFIKVNPELLFDFPAQDVTANFFTFRKADYLPAASSSSANNGRRMASPSKKGGSRYYKVRKGDTLSSISKKLGISINSLCGSNNLKRNSTIRPKQILRY